MIIVNYRPKTCIYRYVLIYIVLFCCFDVCSEVWYTRETWAMFAAEDLLRPSVLASRPKERQRDVRNQVGGCYPRLGQGELVELMERILKERGTTLYVSHLCALSPKFTQSRLLQMCRHGCSTCQCPNISYPSAIKHGHG